MGTETFSLPEGPAELSRAVVDALLALRRISEAVATTTTPPTTTATTTGSGSATKLPVPAAGSDQYVPGAAGAPDDRTEQPVDSTQPGSSLSRVVEAQERVAFTLAALRSLLYGEDWLDRSATRPAVIADTRNREKRNDLAATTTTPANQAKGGQDASERLSTEALQSVVYDTELLELLASSLPLMEFESRKDAVAVFHNILRRQAENQRMQVPTSVLESLLVDYGRPEVALSCGMMLREALRHEDCVRMLFSLDTFWIFFSLLQMSNFDVASDAFTTLRVALTRHKKLAAEFMLQHFDRFFLTEYNNLLRCDNYVSKRQGLKLLSELLLDRSNFYIMIRYVGMVENLKLVMTLMLDPGKSIQLEAFHVFKLIVANPSKPVDVKRILFRNRDKLIRYLNALGSEAPTGNPAFASEAFREDLQLVISEIQKLQPETKSS
jgi:calcium binding protein 39